MQSIRLSRTLIVVVALLSLAAPASATKHIVNVGNFAFLPAKTHVAPGDTVRWAYSNGISHTSTSDPSSPKSWNSPFLDTPGQFFDVVFTLADGPGPFPYHCAVHPLTMLDTIFVNYPSTVHHISVGDFAFTPAKTHVNPGDTVIWAYSSGLSHTSTSDPSSFKSWNSPFLTTPGQFFQVVFTLADGPGPFPYHCANHPLTMLDTIFISYPSTVHHVRVGDFYFAPAKTQVNPGDTVIWVYENGLSHTTTSDLSSPKSWSSPSLATAGDNFQVVFTGGDGPGPFPYHCAVHPLTMLDTVFVNGPPPCTSCGDANGDAAVDISDAVFLIQYIFAGGLAPGACGYVFGNGDANGDCAVDISDAVYLIQYIFAGGSAPFCGTGC